MRIKSVLTHSAQAVVEGALIATLVVGLLAGSALAGKPGGGAAGGGGHHKPGGGGTLTATLAVAPNPVPAQSSFRITGCGYTPNVGIKFVQYNVDGTAVFGGMTDASGCVYNGSGWATVPGTARLEAWVNSVTLTGSTSFTVQ